MTIAFVQQTAVTQAGSSATVQRTLTGVAAGSMLTVTTSDRGGAVAPSGISDDVNGAWNLALGASNTTGFHSGVYMFPSSAAGTVVITVTYAIAGILLMGAQEWSHTGTVELEDSSTNQQTAATTHSHGTVSSAGAGLIITNSIAESTLTETVAAGFTALNDDGFRQWSQRQIVTGATSTDGAFTTSAAGNTYCVAVVYREVAAGGNANLFAGKFGAPFVGKL